ncbi:hypothetical protein SAMN04488530_10325 [Asaccharospora irregularis DSM 2635]|uniref:Uncharacterized protein n=1 Tax=Asaccharospora irregularis DSM 2635 TaxID=1121321 RepID=A0A1M5KL05_9FIRM|nr:hypothetical protein SAMN04488530_10325 [Asaccharospora irregularis DSM 2635]
MAILLITTVLVLLMYGLSLLSYISENSVSDDIVKHN